MQFTTTRPQPVKTKNRRKVWPSIDEVMALMARTQQPLLRVKRANETRLTIIEGTEVHGSTFHTLYDRRWIRMKTNKNGHIPGHYELTPLGWQQYLTRRSSQLASIATRTDERHEQPMQRSA